MAKNDFLLPDELGWQCNDEVSKCVAEWLTKVGKAREAAGWKTGSEFKMFMDVAIAELSDDVYAIIKKYQKKRLIQYVEEARDKALPVAYIEKKIKEL